MMTKLLLLLRNLIYGLQHRWTPLHRAAIFNYKDFAELLIINGANVNAKDNVKALFSYEYLT